MHVHLIQFDTWNTSMAEESNEPCVSKQTFYEHLRHFEKQTTYKGIADTTFCRGRVF